MPANTETLKRDFRKGVADLKKLGAEIRGDFRTASSDARKQWKRFLEPQLKTVERLAKDISVRSQDAVARTAKAFGKFQESLKEPKKSAPRSRPRRRPAASRSKAVRH